MIVASERVDGDEGRRIVRGLAGTGWVETLKVECRFIYLPYDNDMQSSITPDTSYA